MNRESLRDFALQFPDAKEDYPFDDPDTMILRHKSNRKWFAMIIELHGKTCVNLKTDSFQIDALCEMYKGITPGWHMNKRHWITIDIQSDVCEKDLFDFITISYELTRR